ncbi:MAG TPA: DNA polymerase III subunit gamma/tau [Acidimicrobiia bacterium]
MPFQSLYRKYRPQRFDELVGQEHVTTALRNAVREGRVGHAYLFSGPRGTGKTTTGRILAKALNCLDLGADGEPDGTCENCVAIAAGTFNDLVEMDAASNNGVDAIRDLVERVSLGIGATSKVKVYLIDEVHMLSNAASNALLKTLEEPPGHVVFVLATTNPERVLPTIRSRTQHFELTLLSIEQITGLLASVLEREGVEFEPDALTSIARAAGGSARDAESLLDQALAHATGTLTAAGVESVLGGSPFDARLTILDAIAAEDVAGGLTALAGLLESGHDARRVAEDLLRSLRDAFLLTAGRGQVHVDAPEDERERLSAVGEVLGNALVVRGLETLGQAVVDMRGTDAADPRLVLEIALVRLCRRDTGGPLQVLSDRVDRLEQRLADGGSVAPAPAPASKAPKAAADDPPAPPAKKRALGAFKQAPKPATPPESESTAEADPPSASADPAPPDAEPAPSASAAPAPADEVVLDLDDVIVAWSAVLDAVPRSLRSAIQEAQPLRVDGNVITFGVSRTQIDNVKPRFQKEAHAIREKFIEQLGSPPKFKFTVHSWTGTNGGRDRPPRTGPTLEPADVDAGDPGPPPPEDDTIIDLVDPNELVDAPKGAGAAVDSVSRLEDAFGATVIEEVPRT